MDREYIIKRMNKMNKAIVLQNLFNIFIMVSLVPRPLAPSYSTLTVESFYKLGSHPIRQSHWYLLCKLSGSINAR